MCGYAACDAALLLRVYTFLDYWGIINFEANPLTVPSSIRRKREFLMRDMRVTIFLGRCCIYPVSHRHSVYLLTTWVLRSRMRNLCVSFYGKSELEPGGLI